MTEDKLMTPPQVARRLQVNERTVTQWLRKGHLRGFKIGKEWRISPYSPSLGSKEDSTSPGKFSTLLLWAPLPLLCPRRSMRCSTSEPAAREMTTRDRLYR